MSKTFAYVDFYNLMFRNAHTSGKTASLDDKIGLMMHKLMLSLINVKKRFGADYIILCMDKNSWRKNIYPEYKLNRVTQRLKKTPKEQQEDEEILLAANDFFEFFRNKTGLLCCKVDGAEADDVIATNILDNPDCDHIIMSTDSDFYQLVNKRVMIYDPTMKRYLTIDGVFDEHFEPIKDNHGNDKHMGDPEWVLFKKCIRGDSSDNIKTAYPRVREKGTKNKAGILEAFNDRNDKKLHWFDIMYHEWEDGFGNKHLVKDLYERNRQLIDLNFTPDDVKNKIRLDLISQFEVRNTIHASSVGFGFMRFCSKWELYNISERSSEFMNILT